MIHRRKMAVDFGDSRIGIALTDPFCIIASPHVVIQSTTEQKNVEEIVSIIDAFNVDTVVFGLPLNMDSTEGARAAKTREFAKLVAEKTSAAIDFQDERLTSVEAEEILRENKKMNWKKRKELIDKLAASLILESWMRSHKF